MPRARLRHGRGFAASPAQRSAVQGHSCIVCDAVPVDPAHVVSRALGGCDDALCVVPLDRECHRAYDEGRLDLLPYLEPDWRAQLAHAVSHLGMVGALRRISRSHSGAFPPPHPPIERTMPEVVSESEVLALIAACPLHPAGIRNRALIATIWCCGLRTSEVLELAPASLDLDSLTVEVRGRTLGLDRQTGLMIEAWLESRRGLGVAGPLFCTLTGAPLKAAYVRGLLPRLSLKAGLSRPVTTRLLRSAYAVELLRQGTPLAQLSAALGHSAPWITARHLRRIAAEGARG